MMNPKKFWKKIRSRKSSRSPSGGSIGQQSLSDANSGASTTGDPAMRDAVHTSSVIHTSQSHDLQRQQISPSSSASPSSSQNPTTPDNGQHNTIVAKSSPAVQNNAGLIATAYGGVKVALDIVKESADVCIPLKSAVGALTALLKHYDQFIANKDDVQRLIVRVKLLIASLTVQPRENDTDETERRKILERNLNKILETLDPMGKQSGLAAFLKNVDQAAQITGLVEDIRDAIIDYQTSLQQGLNENTMKIVESTDILLLEHLPRSRDAGFLSGNRQKCLKGTRVKVLETIENWVHQNRIRRVYWLNGMAGTGKTTIAQSFAERMFAEGLLGASFFCSRDFPDRRDLHFIFPTLAFQLAYKYSEFRTHLLKTIKSNPDVGRGSLVNQLKMLLVEPLRSTGLSTVIVIDALDECEDEEPASAILSLLAREIDNIPLVKFFITGRPEPRIRKGFRIPTLHPQTEVLLLHEVERQDVDEDIKIFLQYRLTELVKDRSDIDLTTPWPTSEDIRIVTSKAAGHFIYASTVVKFLAPISHNPQQRLILITSMPDRSFYEGQSGIDQLYTCLLDNGCSDIHPSDSGFFSNLLLVVSSVVLSCQPIPLASFARLLNLKSRDILTSLRSLHSVLLIPESDSQPIRVFHKSFPDYLTDRQRCIDSRFFVNSPAHHATLAIRCLELMKTELKKNICNLTWYALNNEIKDLPTRRQTFISEALGYACKFWAKHLFSMSKTGDEVVRVLELLKAFVQRHLLQWLEVLSIIQDLRGAIHSLLDAERWLLEVHTFDEDVLWLIRDSRRFILYSFDAIEQSATHIYHSALVWPPKSSVVRTLYSEQLTAQVKVLSGIDDHWDACTRTIRLGSGTFVPSVVFSHQGKIIAGCSGSVVKIFEAATGACLATLDGHDDDVCSVAFSFGDTFLASGSKDDMVRIWDVQTGALVTKLEGHTGLVRSVAFSPTGAMVASGAHDNFIRIWNFSSGNCERILEGHPSIVLSVCWLQTDKLVSGDLYGNVKIWDTLSGECLKTLDERSGYVRFVVSSLDSSKVASGILDDTIRISDARTGDVLQTVLPEGAVTSVCFSSDGEKIVCATEASVYIWDLAKNLTTFKWKSNPRSVAFSPDGSCVAVGTSDGFVKVYQMESGNQGHDTHNQHHGEVYCVAVAADERTVASGSKDTTVKVWDARTGLCLQTFDGHANWIYSVAFSPDSSLIASGSIDQTVQIWSVPTDSVNLDSSLHKFDGHADVVNSVSFSPNSSLVVSGSDDKTVRIWSLHDQDLHRTLRGHRRSVVNAKFSLDGRRIVSVSRDQVLILWDADSGEKLALSCRGSEIWGVARVFISEDSTRVVLQLHDVVKRWNIRAGAYSFSDENAEASSDDSSDSSSEHISLPMGLVPIQDEGDLIPHDDVRQYRRMEASEWIIDERNRHVCWIPPDQRGVWSGSDGKKVVLGTWNGKVVVLDFSGVSF